MHSRTSCDLTMVYRDLWNRVIDERHYNAKGL
jgi:hypothetical protein